MLFFCSNKTAASQDKSCFETSKDYLGNDITWMAVANVDLCRLECFKLPNCIVFGYHTTNLMCYLKSKSENPSGSDGVIGFRVCKKG